MKRFCLLFVLLFGLTAHAADHAAEDALKNALKGKNLYLRDFSAHGEVKYRYENGALIAPPPVVLVLAAMHIESVKVKSDAVVIEAIRHDPRAASADGAPNPSVSIEINLGSADPSTVLPTLPALLFYDNYDAALAGVPAKFKKMVLNEGKPLAKRSDCNCGTYLDAAGNPVEVPLREINPPRLMHSVMAEFTDAARKAKQQGAVVLAFSVRTNGSPGPQYWLLQTAGYGLDEKALKAVSLYQFQAAFYQGKPVATMITVEVNYDIN